MEFTVIKTFLIYFNTLIVFYLVYKHNQLVDVLRKDTGESRSIIEETKQKVVRMIMILENIKKQKDDDGKC